ncbi:sulfotransferase [Gallaecimonas kandeliae]|uniref:tetratricopeptide repeat-containing sulfotransferase family protein n=1 Tax=Gallaecimonas kandeliae TaxID=3029055 RepID=UPI002648C628|nr:sulfotransferase [Gallaecimonas kandeliae]WKE66157.1 sulfotransferase [Gallaecimonas kandeliae]
MVITFSLPPDPQPLSLGLHQALRLLSGLMQGGKPLQAQALAQALAEQAPDEPSVQVSLLRQLLLGSDFAGLERQARRALALFPHLMPACLGLCLALRYRHAHLEACELLENWLEDGGFGEAEKLALRHQLGVLQKELGLLAEAKANFDLCLAARPEMTEAYWSKADLGVPEERELAAMAELYQSRPWPPQAEAQLCYALGQGWERLGQAEPAFSWYQKGARARRQVQPYDGEAARAELAKIQAAFPLGQALSQAEAGQGPMPIFICGLPRSGTSLLEQLLSALPEVSALGETVEMAQASQQLLLAKGLAQPFPDWVAALDKADWQALGDAYLQRIGPRCEGGWATDKMPMNFKAIGLIKQALPQARILHCRRAPMDNLWGCYKQLFADGAAFSYGLEDLADYYLAYEQLMAHWHRLLPGQILDVQYETLVREPHQTLVGILRFVGLGPSEERIGQCLDFHHGGGAVPTLSASQLRQGLSAGGIGRWRRFAPQLAPLRARLEAGGIAVD